MTPAERATINAPARLIAAGKLRRGVVPVAWPPFSPFLLALAFCLSWPKQAERRSSLGLESVRLARRAFTHSERAHFALLCLGGAGIQLRRMNSAPGPKLGAQEAQSD